MNDAAISGESNAITPLKECPAAFVELGYKINEIIGKMKRSGGGAPMRAILPLVVTQGSSGPAIIEIDIRKLGAMLREDPTASVGGGGGAAGDFQMRLEALEAKLNGYTPVTFSFCDSGSGLLTKTFLVK